MLAHFRGKIGKSALFTLVFAAGWWQSCVWPNWIVLKLFGRTHTFYSICGLIMWQGNSSSVPGSSDSWSVRYQLIILPLLLQSAVLLFSNRPRPKADPTEGSR